MTAARNTCLTWRCTDYTHEMTRSHCNTQETKMSLIYISRCKRNGYGEPCKVKWCFLESPAERKNHFSWTLEENTSDVLEEKRCIGWEQTGIIRMKALSLMLKSARCPLKRFVIEYVVKIWNLSTERGWWTFSLIIICYDWSGTDLPWFTHCFHSCESL